MRRHVPTVQETWPTPHTRQWWGSVSKLCLWRVTIQKQSQVSTLCFKLLWTIWHYVHSLTYWSDCYFVLIVVFYLNVCICVNVSVDCIYRGYTYLYYCILYSGLLETLFWSLCLYKHTEKLILELTLTWLWWSEGLFQKFGGQNVCFCAYI